MNGWVKKTSLNQRGWNESNSVFWFLLTLAWFWWWNEWGEKLPCFWLIKFFIMFLIRLLLVTSWFMAALLLCLVESIPLMYQLASAHVFSVSTATSQCCITGKKNMCRNYSFCDQTWKSAERLEVKKKSVVWRQKELSFFRTPHTPRTNFPSQLLRWSCLRAALYCKSPKEKINPAAKGFEVNPLPVWMFSLSS